MLNGVLDTIKEFLGFRTKKSDILTYAENMFMSINVDVIPALDNIIETRTLDRVKKNNTFKSVFKSCGMAVSDNYEGLRELRRMFMEISKTDRLFYEVIDEGIRDTLDGKVFTARQAVILRILSDVQSMASYTLDIVYYGLCVAKDTVETTYPKVKLTRILKSVSDFGQCYRAYSKNFAKVISKVNEVSVNVITTDTSTAIVESLLNQGGPVLAIDTAGFVGNPIYHFRMWLVDREIDKYEALKAKKQVLELKLLDLKARQAGEPDPSLEKQIAYYEDKVVNIEYKIEKILN